MQVFTVPILNLYQCTQSRDQQSEIMNKGKKLSWTMKRNDGQCIKTVENSKLNDFGLRDGRIDSVPLNYFFIQSRRFARDMAGSKHGKC